MLKQRHWRHISLSFLATLALLIPTESNAATAQREQIALKPVGSGQVTGSVTLSVDRAHKTTVVTVQVTGLPKGIHFAHVHAGRCGDNGEVRYVLKPLTPDAHGNATAVTTYPYLFAPGTYKVVVHDIAARGLRYLACGNL